ncbi:MAG: nicotinate phosphoribosyltransferase [Bacteroidota bacterium]
MDFQPTSSLLTDLYQLTMAQGYFRMGIAERNAVFHLFFRKNPFGGGYCLTAGQAEVMEFLSRFQVTPEEIAYLKQLTGNDGNPMFTQDFLAYLEQLSLSVTVHAMPEGSIAFPHEPLLRVEGPLIQAQLLETALLTLMNFPSLVATKASRICTAAQGDAVLEFGLRRAQGKDGGLTASRAAFVGGAGATSNVWAGHTFGIPVKGTHAHSWVMSYDSEMEAFESYAQALPNNVVLLVDTYDTRIGIERAIEVGQQLKSNGHTLAGIRLDSGNLLELSIMARQMLDDAEFDQAAIVASDDLDEYKIERLKQKGAKIDTWGVGTRLATAYDQPALGGVYKLAALQDETGTWKGKIKLSENPAKTSFPGKLQVNRFYDSHGMMLGDQLYDEWHPGEIPVFSSSPHSIEQVLVPAFVNQNAVMPKRSIQEIQAYAAKQVHALPAGVASLVPDEPYMVHVCPNLKHHQQQLINQLSQ